MILIKKIRREILVALSKLGVKRTKISRGELKFYIPLFHGMGRFLFVPHEPWKRKVLSAVSQMKPKTVLDVGVNVGQTLLDMKEIMPNASYYGFEPNPACVFYVNELIKLNKFPNTSILPFGLSSMSEMKKLYSKGMDDASSSVIERPDSTSFTIYTRKGDDFLREERISDIGFIKIDTEGYECYVLKGLVETIKKEQPIIFCEVFAENEINSELYELLDSLGYLVFEQGKNFSLSEMDSANIFSNPCHDYIFAPRNRKEEFEKHFKND